MGSHLIGFSNVDLRWEVVSGKPKDIAMPERLSQDTSLTIHNFVCGHTFLLLAPYIILYGHGGVCQKSKKIGAQWVSGGLAWFEPLCQA